MKSRYGIDKELLIHYKMNVERDENNQWVRLTDREATGKEVPAKIGCVNRGSGLRR